MTVPNVGPGARSGFGDPLNEQGGFEPEADELTDEDAPGDDTDEADDDASEPQPPADENVPYDASAVGTLSGSGERVDGGE